MTKKIKFLLPLLFCLLGMPFILTSCGDDDDEPNDSTYYDFSIIWDVVDKGNYSTAESMLLVAGLTDDCENIFKACTTARAISEFNEFCEQLRYDLATDYDIITIKATLVRNEGNKYIASKTFYIKPDGTILKKPVTSVAEDAIIVE